ncbi:MAG: signal recognition particle receptor subunit alpha, partial [Corynebacterium matruchotii]
MFESLSDRLSAALSGLRSKGKVTEADVNTVSREIRLALLEADVSLPVVRGFIKRIKERALGVEVSKALNPAEQVIKIVNEELTTILGGETRRMNVSKKPPTVIMLAGLQGAGKTTLAGKLAYSLKEQGHTPILVACDLQRPGAVQQLQIVGERAGVPTFAPDPGTSLDTLEHEMGTTHGDPRGCDRPDQGPLQSWGSTEADCPQESDSDEHIDPAHDQHRGLRILTD